MRTLSCELEVQRDGGDRLTVRDDNDDFGGHLPRREGRIARLEFERAGLSSEAVALSICQSSRFTVISPASAARMR